MKLCIMLLHRKGGNASSGGWRSTPPSAGERDWRSPAAMSVCQAFKLLLSQICIQGLFLGKNVTFRENTRLQKFFTIVFYFKSNWSSKVIWSLLNLDQSFLNNTQLTKQCNCEGKLEWMQKQKKAQIFIVLLFSFHFQSGVTHFCLVFIV